MVDPELEQRLMRALSPEDSDEEDEDVSERDSCELSEGGGKHHHDYSGIFRLNEDISLLNSGSISP